MDGGALLGGRYRLRELIGYGGSADVYAAADELLGRVVAVKVFKSELSDAVNAARRRSEMQLSAALNHPNLVTVHDARVPERDAHEAPTGAAADPAYLVMELVAGSTLADLVAQGPMAEPAVRRLALGLVDALRVIHAAGLVHRDVKPANILITDTGVAKISDFGIARLVDAAHLTATMDVVGTAAYLSPEQASGQQVDSATDVYALGLVLLECLTGRREFPGPPLESALARLRRDPEVSPTLPSPWPAMLTAMTQADPTTRPTAAEVLDLLHGSPDAAPALPLALAAPAGPAAGDPTVIERSAATSGTSAAYATSGTSAAYATADADVTRVDSAPPLWTPAKPGRKGTSRRRWIGWAAAVVVAGATALIIAATNQNVDPGVPIDQVGTSQSQSVADPSGVDPSADAAGTADQSAPPASAATSQTPPAVTTTEQLPPVTTTAPAVTETVTSGANGAGKGDKGTSGKDEKSKATKTKEPKSK